LALDENEMGEVQDPKAKVEFVYLPNKIYDTKRGKN